MTVVAERAGGTPGGRKLLRWAMRAFRGTIK